MMINRMKRAWNAILIIKREFSTETSLLVPVTSTVPDVLKNWSEHQWISPPVNFVEGQEPPTALSWIRRRGPDVPNALIHKLFRKRQVRIFDGDKIKQVNKTRTLSLGNQVLLPSKIIEEKSLTKLKENSKALKEASEAKDGIGKVKGESLLKTVQEENRRIERNDRRLLNLANQFGQWIIYSNNDICAINKPAGIPSQGGKNITASIDRIAEIYAKQKGWPEAPKLDRHTSGVLVLAKNALAASWLSEAFKNEVKDDVPNFTKKFFISKIYWAIVDARYYNKNKGKIETQMRMGKVKLPSETHYETKAIKDGLAILRLKPITGRKHQLRMHCAFKMNAPIIGDRLYSQTRNQHNIPFFEKHKKLFGKSAFNYMYLHSCEVIIRRFGKKPIRIQAAVPDYMNDLMHAVLGTNMR